MASSDRCEIAVAGHYCHDTIVGKAGEHRVLGGSAAYGGAILAALGVRFRAFANVGGDFLYRSEVAAQPRVVEGERTTAFVDDYTRGERSETLQAVCSPIEPAEIDADADVAIACPIAGELPPRTVHRLRERAGVLVADVQGFIRAFGPAGEVTDARLEDTPFVECVQLFDYLKVSASEARALDMDGLLRKTRVIVTDGNAGCTLLQGGGPAIHVDAFPAIERDSTGAGDCFLAGFAFGLLRHFPIERALRFGNWCGARAVEHVGIPRLQAGAIPEWARAV